MNNTVTSAKAQTMTFYLLPKQVWFTVLPERAIMEKPFRKFMQVAVRSGELGYHYLDVPRMRTDCARDYAVEQFLKVSENPYDTLVMLDCDHKNHPYVVERLVAHDKPVVAAVAVRSNPLAPELCHWKRDENGQLYIPRTVEGKLERVAITGAGAIAIKRSVFTTLIERGFDKGLWKYQYHPNGDSSSEEIFFGQVCENEGIEVYVDTGLEAPHWIDGELNLSSHDEWVKDHPAPVRREHKVSVIVPQYKRYEKFEKCFRSLIETAPKAEIIIVIDPDDEKTLEILAPYDVVKIVTDKRERAIDKWNIGASKATGDILMVAANDVVFESGWYENALKAFDTLPNGGMVSVNDTHTDPNVSAPHFLMSRDFIIKHNGGVLMPPCYDRQYPDVENMYKAKSLGMYEIALDSIVRHDHPLTGSAKVDEVHQEMFMVSFDADKELCRNRMAQGFPIVWDAVIK